MSKPVSIGQSHNVISILANNVDWDSLDGDVLQRVINNPREAGANFTTFLKYGARGIIVGQKGIPINRSRAFNPAEFIGKGWTIVEQDERSLVLTEVDLTKVCFKDCLQKGETAVNGEEKLKRLKQAGHIRLDAKIFQTLWENQFLIPESWKEKIDGKTHFIFFDGTVFRGPNDNRYIFCLDWGGGEWWWGCLWLGDVWFVNNSSAVLTS